MSRILMTVLSRLFQELGGWVRVKITMALKTGIPFYRLLV